MGLLRLANPLGRRFRLDRITPAGLLRMAWNASYRAPRAAEVLDPSRDRFPELPRFSEDERRLLDAVLADPDSDAPRLAYADWTERQGDKRPDHAARLAPFGAKDLVVRRGFVEGMSLTGRAFISLGDRILRMTPLRELRLVAVQPLIGELARCPHLARLRRLDLLGNRIGPVGIRELAESPYLSGLRELNLADNHLGSEGVAALVRAPWLANLTALELAGNGLHEADVRRLLASCPEGLSALDLSRNSLGPDGSRVLAHSEVEPQLRRLALAGCGLGPDGALALVSGERFSSLTELDLSFNSLGPVGTSVLFREKSFPNLAALHLGFNDIENDGAASLNSLASSLVRLTLAGNRITERGAVALATAGYSSLGELDVTANPIGDAGAVQLLREGAFTTLQTLRLANGAITDRGVGHLAAHGALAGLRALSLAWNAFGDEGVKALTDSTDLADLQELDLRGTRIGLAGAVALSNSTHLPDLRVLRLGENNRLPSDGIALLRERFGTITAERQP